MINYPVWRRNLDVYAVMTAKNGKQKVGKLAQQFHVTTQELHRITERVEEILEFDRGKPGSAYARLEALCVSLANFAPEREVLRLAKVLYMGELQTLEDVKRHNGTFRSIKGVGPLYDEILKAIRDNKEYKNLCVRISYKGYLALTESAKNSGTTVSKVIDRLIREAPFM